MLRGRTIFHDEEGYGAFSKRLSTTIERFGWLCHASCLMPNHFHLEELNGSYTRRHNARYDRTGHVLEAPYRATHVATDAYFDEVRDTSC